MAGAETIAGLALAAPPLVVSWLEHERELSQMFGRWKRFRPEYRKVERQLQGFELSLGWTVEKLFSQFVESQHELEKLKLDRDSKDWVKLEEMLRQRLLPEVRKLYRGLLEDLQDAIEELEQKLGYDKEVFQSELLTNSKDSTTKTKDENLLDKAKRKISYEAERVKFSIRAKPIEDALHKVEALLGKIQDLLSQNDETAERRASEAAKKSQSAIQRNLLHFWRHAQAVYELVLRSWSCECLSQHSANLLLLHRTSPDVLFDMLFQYTHPLPEDPPWRTRWARLERTERATTQRIGTAITFATPQVSQTPQQVNTPRILDLCRTIAAHEADHNLVGLLTGPGCGAEYAVTSPSEAQGANFVTLDSLLRRNAWERPERLSRYRIAATLASSHLQLHCSKWLQEGWTKDNIFFSVFGDETDLERPHLRRKFANIPALTPAPDFDIGFVTLAILLLELCFGCTMEASPFQKDRELPDGTFDLTHDRNAAWKWATEVGGEADERYAHAVDWCLNRWKVREEDNAWRDDFYRNVVIPLRVEAGLEEA